jgi:phosphotransferase system HPr (HPr) family protein
MQVMLEKQIVVGHPSGLQARVATDFVKKASMFKSDIDLIIDGRMAVGKSIMSVMGLALRKGGNVTIRANENDEQKVIRELEDSFTEIEKIGRRTVFICFKIV